MNNELIKELAKQCYETGPIGKDGWPEYSRLNEEKFAELIVLECVEICRSDDWEDQQGWGKLYAHKIKKHFGVKE